MINILNKSLVSIIIIIVLKRLDKISHITSHEPNTANVHNKANGAYRNEGSVTCYCRRTSASCVDPRGPGPFACCVDPNGPDRGPNWITRLTAAKGRTKQPQTFHFITQLRGPTVIRPLMKIELCELNIILTKN